MSGSVRVADADGLREIVIDRPEKANALTAGMLETLRDAVAGTDADALILSGAGHVFSGGADLDAAREGLVTSPLWGELSEAITAYRGLSIAALNGACAGGALGMALAADLRVAAPHAVFFYPVLRLGYLPPVADIPRLLSLLGPARTRLLLMTGARWSAAEALCFGLVDAVEEDALTAARRWAAVGRTAPAGHAAAIAGMIAAATGGD